LTINPFNSKVNAVIVNNTFLNNKVENGKELAVSIQPAITIADLSIPKKAFGVDLILLNNLFIENKRSGFDQDVDLYIDPVDITLSVVSNNIFNKTIATDASEFISTTTNKVSSTYTYSSSEIEFVMNGSLPKIELSEQGIPYVLPSGIEIVGKGIANDVNSSVPINDIRNIVRKSTPDVGATDYYDPTSSLSLNMSRIKVYTEGKLLIIISEENPDFTIKVSDIAGRQIYISHITSDYFSKTFDLSGILIVTIESKCGIVKQKVIL